MVKVSALFFILAAIASTNAAVIRRAVDPSVEVTVESEALFCSFLPKTPGEEIGASEGDAIPFCTQANPTNAPDAKVFPDGFILSQHFVSTDSYVQVTGRMDGSKYQLSPNDGGGQYDSVGAPPGATCAGFKKFVNLIEPDIGHYCIRCCKDASDCETGRSTDGCESIIPGDYS